MDEQTVSHVIHLISGVKYLRGVDWLLRSAARQTRMAFAMTSELPYEFPTPDQEQATTLYFRRLHSGGGRFASRAGVLLADGVRRPIPPLSVLTVTRRELHHVTETWDYLGPTGAIRTRTETIPAYFGIGLICYRRLADFVACDGSAHVEWPPGTFGTAATLLRIAADLDNRGRYNHGVRMLGYNSVDTEFLPDLLRPYYDHAVNDVHITVPQTPLPDSPERLIDSLTHVRGDVRPLRAGSIIRVDGDLTLVDAAAATARLEYDLSLPSVEGALANARARYFERQIQGIVDGTRWKPSECIRALIGRHLESEGRQITDVDAIGCCGDTLLIVSAKSKLFTRSLESGDFAAVRNATSMVVDACEDAGALARLFKLKPKGSNYDFSRFSTIAVVVCVPYTLFVPIGSATGEVLPGLRAAVSVSELESFLTAGTT